MPTTKVTAKGVRTFYDVHPDGNRKTRRTQVAVERQMPGTIKKQNIRNAHDKIIQRDSAKRLLKSN